MQRTFLFLADGFEEIEALTVIDILRRGKVTVDIVSITTLREVTGAHGICVKADRILNEIVSEEATCLILPGGMPGAENLSNSIELMNYLQRHVTAENLTAAICAAPALVLGKIMFPNKMDMTCYPGFENYLPDMNVIGDGVVVDDFLITGRGPAYAAEFGLTILKYLESKEVADAVAVGMLLTEK